MGVCKHKLFVAFLFLFSLNCNSSSVELRVDCNEVCGVGVNEQKAFEKQTVERQYEFAVSCRTQEVCRRDSSTPPFTMMLLGNKATQPFVFEKIKSEKDKEAQLVFLIVLRQVAIGGKFEGRQDVVALANQIADEMTTQPIDAVFVLVGGKNRKQDAKEIAQGIERYVQPEHGF